MAVLVSAGLVVVIFGCVAVAAGRVWCGLSLERMIAVRLRGELGFSRVAGLRLAVHENHETNLRVSQMQDGKAKDIIAFAERVFRSVISNLLGDNHGMDYTCSD